MEIALLAFGLAFALVLLGIWAARTPIGGYIFVTGIICVIASFLLIISKVVQAHLDTVATIEEVQK